MLIAIGAATAFVSANVSEASDQCDIRTTPEPQKPRRLYARNQLIVSGYGDDCEIKRLVTPNYDCSISYEAEHGNQMLSCGDLYGRWLSGGGGYGALAMSSVGSRRKIRLPSHSKLRSSWLAPLHTEGLHESYPIRMDDYIDLYPKHFTSVGEKRNIENTTFRSVAQTHHYETMNGKRRVAVTGEAALGCLRLSFWTWVDPTKAEMAERDMASFLGDLSLEAVEAPEAELKEAICKRRG